VVKGGDNLTQISLKTGITIKELREINDIDADNTIFPGQKLKLE
jgi:LysM repeat protein